MLVAGRWRGRAAGEAQQPTETVDGAVALQSGAERTRIEEHEDHAAPPGGLGAVAALAVVASGGGAAAASTASKAKPAVIEMARDGKELFFERSKDRRRPGAT